MKNIIIIVLSVAVLGLGGWAVYDKTNDSGTSSSNSTISGDGTVTTDSSNTLDLSGKGLTKVGADIYDKTGTTQLILSDNSLKTLPSEMGRMTRLEVLKLDHNLLEGSLIGEIRKMPLKVLDVSYNNMTGMPAEIGQLSKLEALNYSYNNIDTLPNEIGNLRQLKQLNLTGNPLSAQKIADLRAKLPNTQIIF